MIVKKVKLIQKGTKGIEVLFDAERKISDQMKAKRDNTIKENFPLPIPLRQKFDRLKYFFLVLSGIWKNEWTDYLLDDCSDVKTLDQVVEENGLSSDESNSEEFAAQLIMEVDTALKNTQILGYEIVGNSIKIVGKYEVVEGKPFDIKLPFISDEDDFSLHDDAISIMDEISTDVVAYLKEEKLKLEDIKGILLEFTKSGEDKERIQKQNEEESMVELMERLEEQAIVIPIDGTELHRQLGGTPENHEENEEDTKTKLASNGTINDSRFNDSEEDDEKEPDDDEIKDAGDDDDNPYFGKDDDDDIPVY